MGSAVSVRPFTPMSRVSGDHQKFDLRSSVENIIDHLVYLRQLFKAKYSNLNQNLDLCPWSSLGRAAGFGFACRLNRKMGALSCVFNMGEDSSFPRWDENWDRNLVNCQNCILKEGRAREGIFLSSCSFEGSSSSKRCPLYPNLYRVSHPIVPEILSCFVFGVPLPYLGSS